MVSCRLLTVSTLIVLVTPPVSGQEATLIIENGRVIVGDGTVRERATVVVAGNRIVFITEDPLDIPGARRIDATGKTVLPGLIDTHVHLTMGPDVEDEVSLESFLGGEVPEILSAFLRHGITTLRSAGDYWPAVGELRDRIATGEMPGPRLLVAGPVLTANASGHGAVCPTASTFCRKHLFREVQSAAEAREAVGELAAEGVDFVKLFSDSAAVSAQISEEVVAAIVEQAHVEGLEAVGHVAERSHVRSGIAAGLDGLMHPVRDLASEEAIAALAQRLVREGVPVASTLSDSFIFYSLVGGPAAPDTLDSILEGRSPWRAGLEGASKELTALGERGVQLVVGSDWCACILERGGRLHPSVLPGAITHTEMELLAWGGMVPMAVLRAATADAARAVGLGHVLGTLKPGKLADLIVVNGDPTIEIGAIRNVELVVKDGEVVFSR
jgi:imidazolonepropionase-like amidohydrolase